MGTCEITEAAIGTYTQLLAVTGRRLRTHGCPDGGLICEDRASPARPRVWKISPDGGLIADSLYSFGKRAFTTAALPQGV